MKKLIPFVFLLLRPASVFCEETTARDLSGGMYTNADENVIPDNTAPVTQNYLTDIQPMGVERNGYTRRDSTILGGGTGAAGTGLWTFFDSSGNEWTISFSSKTFYKNTVGGTPTSFGLSPTTTQIPNAAVNLGKIWFVNGVDSLWWFDGTSTGAVASAPIGKLITAWRNRVVIANIPSAQSTVRLSADGDGTNWTLGGNPTDPFAIQIGGANDGQYVRCIWGSYQDSMIIGRKYDLWAVDGFQQDDYVTRNVSIQIGCIEPRSMQEIDGSLIFMSARGVEQMRGREITRISEPIQNTIDIMIRNTINQRSNTQTTKADFDLGTISSPSNGLSTSINPGSVVLSTAATQQFADSTSGNFAAGTKTQTQYNVGTSSGLSLNFQLADQLAISTGITAGNDNYSCSGSYYLAQQYVSSSTLLLTSVTLVLKRTGIPPATYAFNVLSDNSGAPGVLIASQTVTMSFVPTLFTATHFSMSIPYARLQNGTTYWFQLVPLSGTCDASNHIGWDGGTKTGSHKYAIDNTITSNKEYYFNFQLYQSKYFSSGDFVSRVYDIGLTTTNYLWNWGALSVNQGVPPLTTLQYQLHSSADGVNFLPYAPVVNGAVSTGTVGEFVQYRATFTTTDLSASPTAGPITVNLGPFISTAGIFTTQLINTGSLVTAWGVTTISASQSTGTITTQIGSTNMANVNAISNWQTITTGQIPTISTNPYIAFKSSFTPTNYAANLSLQEISILWTEGTVAASPVSANYDRRYWLSFTTNTNSNSYQDTVLVYQRTKAWTIFNGIYAASFSLWGDHLYFGNSNGTGLYYKYDVGDNDDGASITSILRTRSFNFGVPYKDKDFRTAYVDVLKNSSFSGSFSVSHDIDRYGTLYSMGSSSLNDTSGVSSEKFQFPLSSISRGKEVQYSIVKSDTGDRLKLYGITTKYSVRQER